MNRQHLRKMAERVEANMLAEVCRMNGCADAKALADFVRTSDTMQFPEGVTFEQLMPVIAKALKPIYIREGRQRPLALRLLDRRAALKS